MLKNHSNGLIVLALTNMGERFGYYTMLAILTLYMQAKFGFSTAETSMIYGVFLALVYFLPIFGGLIADKWLGYGKTILTGVVIMFAGYLLLALPFGVATTGVMVMFLSLFLISAGTGLFKGNLQALVGKLYDDPRYSKNRDIAFSIFYMFINVGAFFAPAMGNYLTNNQLAKDGLYYDANIPKDYVSLNNKVVDEATFMNELRAQKSGFDAMAEKDQAQIVKEAKKKQGVMFEQDKNALLFNLKLAGLYQYTKNNVISDPTVQVSEEEWQLMSHKSTDPNVLAQKAALTERVNNITEDQLAVYKKSDDASLNFAQDFGKVYVVQSLSHSYTLAFLVACISLVISVLIFMFFRKTWKAADMTAKQAAAKMASNPDVKPMSKEEVRERMVALFLVFAVVIFFWMAFHQNGLTMTFFARDYTASQVSGQEYILFSLWTILPFVIFMYGIYLCTFGLLGSDKNVKSGLVMMLIGAAAFVAGYFIDIKPLIGQLTSITPQIFMQFNPIFIILLTPVTVAIFTALARKGKEPSAPRKIGIGMLLAAVGFLVLTIGSIGLPDPSTLNGASDTLISPNWLIGTYLVLTLAELFLSPMGLSFVSKVAPPQYSGLMQGGWLAATAIGNFLVGAIGAFWEKMSLVAFWGVLIVCCLLSAAFIFMVMKRLERVTADK